MPNRTLHDLNDPDLDIPKRTSQVPYLPVGIVGIVRREIGKIGNEPHLILSDDDDDDENLFLEE